MALPLLSEDTAEVITYEEADFHQAPSARALISAISVPELWKINFCQL